MVQARHSCPAAVRAFLALQLEMPQRMIMRQFDA
jgi:hypothetical protein